MTYMELLELWNNGTIKTTEEFQFLVNTKGTISEAEMDWKDLMVSKGLA